MEKMKRVTVFCGSSFGNDSVFGEVAYELGKTLAEQQIKLVYGGANVGLMGAVANGVLDHGGEVTGVLPRFLQEKEIAHRNLTELILVEDMHERKKKMNELSDGAIALPGGFGTMEELFEMLTWGQLGLHRKPVAVLNTNGFFDDMLSLVGVMINKGFIAQRFKDMLIHDSSIPQLLETMKNYSAPMEKWIVEGE